MATQYANGKIVTNGLVLCLDAADRNSYPGSGTTWRDLSGNGYNASVGSNVNFVNRYGGGLSFSNSATTANSNIVGSTSFSYTSWTWEIVIQINGSIGPDPTGFFGMIDSGGVTSNGFRNGGNYTQFSAGGVWVSAQINNTTPNTVSVRTIIRDSTNLAQYNNGSLYNTGTVGSGTGTIVTYGVNISNYVSATNSIDGIVYDLRIYNRALTATEILQNYNAQKARFGL